MLDFLRFWLILALIGLAGLPLSWRLFAFLPDHGFVFSRALGLLGAGYLLWLGATFGLLRNTTGGAALALLIFAALGLWLGRAGWQKDGEGKRPLLEHLRTQKGAILFVEIFFLLAMAAWAYFRAYNPDIAGTEKPMEFAFLNGILNSPQFPPRDPWLAGYGISYYYFGYAQLNLLVQLTGVQPSIAFNLGLAAIFALTLLGGFGLVYNLVRGDSGRPATFGRGLVFGLIASLFLGLMGNLVGVLEALQARGLLSSRLLGFFDVKELANAPVIGAWNPGSGHWWWWRASRVIHDRDFSGQFDQEVISEFPFFSFLLGDMHPHVLALPFVLLALALALNLFRRPATAVEKSTEFIAPDVRTGWRAVVISIARLVGRVAARPAGDVAERLAGITSVRLAATAVAHPAWATVVAVFGLDGWGLPLYGLALGALGFLNTWDFPIYVFLVTLVYGLRRGLGGARLDRRLWTEIALTFVALAVIGFVGYLPFYLSFSSQASGIWPNFYNPTRLVQYLLMFGPFLAALILLLVAAWQRLEARRSAWLRWLLAVLLLPLILLVLATLLAALLPSLRGQIEATLGQTAGQLIPQLARIRVSTPGTWLFVGGLLSGIGALLASVFALRSEGRGGEKSGNATAIFALALFFTALLLTYGVEFVFLRDTFGTRMNTVFKFYYQAWIMMAMGSAYALYYLSTRAGRGLRWASWTIMAVLVLGGMVYPLFAIPSKANNFQGQPSLDGARYVAQYRPDEAAVTTWLKQNTAPDAVILEASGGSYSDYNFIAADSGRPTLLGWGGHELQWRGNYVEAGRREPLIETIYQNRDEERIRAIVAEFGIDYLIVGPRELDKYKIAPDRRLTFINLWQPVFEQGGYSVFAWRG